MNVDDVLRKLQSSEELEIVETSGQYHYRFTVKFHPGPYQVHDLSENGEVVAAIKNNLSEWQLIDAWDVGFHRNARKFYQRKDKPQRIPVQMSTPETPTDWVGELDGAYIAQWAAWAEQQRVTGQYVIPVMGSDLWPDDRGFASIPYPEIDQ